MSRTARKSVALTKSHAKRIWLHAQRLDEYAPFGGGPEATLAAVEHLGHVQIDTTNVIERCHHQILYTRIPAYQRDHLRQAQTVDKTVFEYWTHALSYLPTKDMRFCIGAMKRDWQRRSTWFGAVRKEDLHRILARIKKHGALTIRDIDDDVLVEKDHAWASRKPSKRALQLAFYRGLVTVSQRTGMLKTYELMDRHFGWKQPPKPASEKEILNYLLDRALRSQGIVSVGSIYYLDPQRKPAMRRLIEARVRRNELVSVELAGQRSWSTGRGRRRSMPPSIQPKKWSISCLPSTRSSISASGCISSSTTSTASRLTSPRRSGYSATSPSPCS